MYQDTDVRIHRDVVAELAWEPQVVSTDINVAVSNGVVTLTGRVGDDAERGHVTRAARRVAMVSSHSVWGSPDKVEVVDQLTLL